MSCWRHSSPVSSFSGVQGGLAFSGPGNYTGVLLERSHVRVGASPLFCWRKETASAPDCRWTLIREAGPQGRLESGLAGWLN
jgi:hypothetical protein